MIVLAQINNHIYKLNADSSFDIAIPLNFNGAQPKAYGVEKATSKPCQAGTLIGDTRCGGSCNFEQYTFIPHCNGTHTECVGHITNERISIHDCLKDAFVPARLISIEPETAIKTNETYSVSFAQNDKLITRRALENALQISNSKLQTPELEGLIVRTLPNEENKKTRIYLESIPPFFSTEAMQFIAEQNFRHLLVDVPSIDRIFDDGKLSNHRRFWNVAAGAFEIGENSHINNTITEMIFVPDWVTDGAYLLNLQIPPFAADAAPSRPILFELTDD